MSDLLKFRKRFKITQVEAAKIFGCSLQSWYIWEIGRRDPPEYIRGWVDYLDESPLDGIVLEKFPSKMAQLGGIRVLAWLSVEIWRGSFQKNKPRPVTQELDSPGRAMSNTVTPTKPDVQTRDRTSQ